MAKISQLKRSFKCLAALVKSSSGVLALLFLF